MANEKKEKKTQKENKAPKPDKAPKASGEQKDNKKDKKPSKRFTKRNEVPIIIVSIALGFTIFFFSPIDIFLGNQREFVVSFSHALIPMLLTAITASAIFVAIQNLFLLINKKLGLYINELLFGLLIAMYMQMLFLNGKMTSLTGDDADYYNDDSLSVTINLAVFVLLIFLPSLVDLAVYYTRKKKTPDKPKGGYEGKVIPYLSALIFAMQLVGCTTSMLTADYKKYQKSYTEYLSYEPAMSLSKDNNVVVFLCDRLDSFWMDKVLEEYPELEEKFEGFTFYQNNVSHNTQTFPAVPQMITRNMYKGTEWADYISESWDGDTVSRLLNKNGYHVNLLIDNLTSYSTVAQLSDQCDNIGSCDKDNIRINYLGYDGVVATLSRISLAKLSPYAIKGDITLGMGASPASGFVKYKTPMPDSMPMAVDVDSDLKYFDYLKKHGLTADSKAPTYSFIHLNCAHDYSRELTDLYEHAPKVSRWTTIRGGFEILFYYMEQMKELGVYDNSTIIILGDHGRAPEEIEVDGKDTLDSPIMPALLVKPQNAEAKPLAYDTESELSNDFFAASVLEYAGLEHEGYSYNDIINGDIHPDRYVQTAEFGGYGKVYYKTLYKINGDARDFNNWEPQSKHE